MADYQLYRSPVYDPDSWKHTTTDQAPGYTGSDPYMLYQNGMPAAAPDPYSTHMASVGSASAPQMPTTDYSGLASAGIGAAGTTAATLASIIAQSQARASQLAEANVDRDSTAELARMRIRAQAEMADKERQLQARNFLLQAVLKRGGNAVNELDTKRQANRMGSSLIAQAYL